jgi:hypothetical protein
MTRRKDNDSDMRTVTEDIPALAMFVVPPILAVVWFFNRVMAGESTSDWMTSWKVWTAAAICLATIWAWRKNKVYGAIIALLAGACILWINFGNADPVAKPAETPAEYHAAAPPKLDYGSALPPEQRMAQAADHAISIRLKEAFKKAATHNDNHSGISARIIIFDDPLDAPLPAEEPEETHVTAITEPADRIYYAPSRVLAQTARPARKPSGHRERRAAHWDYGYDDPYGIGGPGYEGFYPGTPWR